MCLQFVTKQYNKTQNKVHLGYKVFMRESDGKLGFRHYFMRAEDGITDCFVPQNQWLKATNTNLHYTGIETIATGSKQHGEHVRYRRGFHVFRKFQDAEDMAKAFGGDVYKVRFRNVTSKGTENYFGRDLEIVVAEEIFVPKDDKNGS